MNTFTDFKKDFYSRVPDFTLFDCNEINLLKVVLDGLKVDYISKGKVRAYLFYPIPVFNTINRIKQRVNYNKNQEEKFKLNIEKLKDKIYLVSDFGRIVYDAQDKPKSIYFDNIIQVLNRSKTVVVMDKVIDQKIDYDISMKEVYEIAQYLPLTNQQHKFRSELLATYYKIKNSKKFDKKELSNIKYAIHKFFIENKVWSYLLSHLRYLQKCYFICHYHKEGQILALKKSNIKCIELQHGLIAKQDIFYLFPEITKDVLNISLFADEILVYGKYWKNLLLQGFEYSETQIKEIGYYLYDDFKKRVKEKNELKILTTSKVVIFITTQTFLHRVFIDFTKKLEAYILENNIRAVILLKPHPAENKSIYTNEFDSSKIINVITYPLPIVFEIANIHISIYSTTLYDALRYGVKNFVFNAKGCEDYVNEIVLSSVASEIIDFADIFNSHLGRPLPKIDKNNFYSILNEQVLI